MLDELRCPACQPSLPMFRLRWQLAEDLALYRCGVCLGVLAHHDAVAAAKKHYDPAHPVMSARPSAHRCRQCHATAHTGSASCKQCSASLLLACPLCSREMEVLAVAQVVVDVCRPCELAFFDRGELASVCNEHAAFSNAMRPARESFVASRAALELAGNAPLETAEVMGLGARAAGKAGLMAAQAATEEASTLAEGILEVLSGIFDL